jgi:aryl-alcohol dehydrogenase-like predicted oxidoreductase
METRTLGNSNLNIAPLVFGGNVFGWTVDEASSFRLLDEFVAKGFNMVDTANSYSRWVPGHKGGESETIIGNWFKQSGKRDKVLIATKVGSDMGEGKKGVSRKHIVESVEESLKRLQTDHIDLYQTHFDDEATPVEETMEAYAQLVKDGKVRFLGTSNMSIARIKASVEVSEKNGWPRYETLQPLYNLYDREKFETEYKDYCLDKNISVIPYYSLASGFLTGKYRSEADFNKSPRGGGMKKYLNGRGMSVLKALDTVAARHEGTTPATVSLAWLMAKPGVAAPIASATSIEQLQELFKSVDLKLSTEDMELLDKA